MTKSTNIDTELDEFVQLIADTDVEKEMGTAFSSVMLNPAVNWAKFVLTDDKPNVNRQRVPHEEFANLIRSGIFMPIKMALNGIQDGHDGAIPLGVITHLKEDGNRIVALAALWSKERPEDVQILRDRINKGLPVNISWEIQYSNSVLEDGGIEALQGTELSAATVVGMPAYAGRTPMVAFAAKRWSQPYIDSLPDTSFLYVEPDKEKDSSGKTLPQFRHYPVVDADNNVDIKMVYAANEEIGGSTFADSIKTNVLNQVSTMIEMYKKSVDGLNKQAGIEPAIKETKFTMDEKEINELKAKLDLAEAKVTELETRLTASEAALAEKDNALASTQSTLTELQAYKDAIEGEKIKTEKLASIKQKFADAQIERPEEYFTANAETFLEMKESDLEFMVQELSSFSKKPEALESEASTKIPPLTTTGKGTDTKVILEALRARNKK